MKVTVITVSDRAARGIYADLSGPAIEKILKENIADVAVCLTVVPDEKDRILQALRDAANADFILTTGGTGLGPRDLTPEICREYCDSEIPGIAEVLRSESYKETPNAMLSRGYAGIKNKTVIVNFPGSVRAVSLCTRILLPVMAHALKMINNEGH